MTTAASGSDAASSVPLFTKLTQDQVDQVDWDGKPDVVVVNAKAPSKKAWDEKGEKYFVLRDPLASYKEGDEMPPPPPPPEEDPNAPDFCIAFPRSKFTEVSEHIKRLVDVFEEQGKHRPIVMTEVSPEALQLLADFMKNHLTDKLREIPKPMRDHVRTYLSESDKNWVAKWVDWNNVYDNWLLFRMVDAAEVLLYEDFSTIVAAVLGECLKDKKVTELRKFFHEKDPHGGFSKEEEAQLMKQCRESWPESKHLFDVAE